MKEDCNTGHFCDCGALSKRDCCCEFFNSETKPMTDSPKPEGRLFIVLIASIILIGVGFALYKIVTMIINLVV